MNTFFYWVEGFAFFIIVWWSFLWWFGRVPKIESIKQFFEALNTKGGNILILLVMSVVGAFATTRMFYYLVQLSVDGKLQQDNAYALMGLAFLTNQLTGAFIGALLKTMTGDALVVQVPQTVAPTPQKEQTKDGSTNVSF